jgi:hypothetical protein
MEAQMTIALLVQIVIVLLVFGLIFWAVDQIPGLPAPVPAVVKVILVLLLCVWLLRMVGVA